MSRAKEMGAALIIAGTAIGAGILGMPIATASGGFLPSLLVYVLCWGFSLATGLLFLELCLWMPQNANIISMAKHLLGKWGAYGAWALYLFLFYTLLVAYISGGGSFVTFLSSGSIGAPYGALLFTLIFGLVVYLGTKLVDRINSVLMLGLFVTFVLFAVLLVSKVDFSLLTGGNLWKGLYGLPVVFTAFSYQGTLPSLNTYLKANVKKMRFAIFVGTLIPFVVYVVWQFLILGVFPLDGEYGLLVSDTAIDPVIHFFPTHPVRVIGQFFAAFAIISSFLGVSLGLLDFLSDGLQIVKEGSKKLLLALLVFVPPLLFTLFNPNVFLRALGYAGGFGCALLLGLYPILMVWIGRYKQDYPKLTKQLPGGKWVLICLLAFVVFEVGLEIVQELHIGY